MTKADTARDRLIVVGQVAGAFGVKGEARVRSYTGDPEAIFDYGPLMDEQGAVVLTPVSARPLGDVFGVITEEQVQREHWEDLKGQLLHVRRSILPEPDEDEVYVTDLIGLAVEHVDGRKLGVVTATQNFGAGDLLEVKGEGVTLLIPFTLAAIPEIDLEARLVRVSPDEELLPEALQRQPSPRGTN